jgi:succinyl-diaminopimelate desuccinylase
MPNFKKLSRTYEKNALVALEQFVRIPSVYDESTAKVGQPYGEGVKKALDYFAKLGQDYGFAVNLCDGYCTELSVGSEGPLIGVYGHSDVVPATGVWDHPPFDATLQDGRLWGRGTCDDKGPLIAALYAVKLLKDNGLIKGFRVKIVSGGDEERGSSCLRYYFERHHGEEPLYGFTPDAVFPLIYAEKGIRDYWAVRLCDLSPIIAMDGGVVMNAVCDSLLVTLKPDPKFAEYLKEKKVSAEVTIDESLMLVKFLGKSAHGSTPQLGINAATEAFRILGTFYKLAPLTLLAAAMKDPNGQVFGGFNESEELGPTTYNFGIIKYDGKTLKVSLDFRYGEGAAPDQLIAAFEAATKTSCAKLAEMAPLLFDKKSPLVATLMAAYRRSTFDFFAKPLAIGGGTYAKEAKNTVAFGASWKGHEGNMHSPNEYLYVDDFNKDIAIYARALYMLGRRGK